MSTTRSRVEHVPPAHMPRLPALDGWRAISILAVMQCHYGPWYPAGSWVIDAQTAWGQLGMALFFCLSGFLITSALYFNPSVRVFLIRRVFRIVPAVWLFLALTLPAVHPRPTLEQWWRNLFFLSNIPPCYFVEHQQHLWSLCVEVQFYAGIALLFLLLRRWTFPLLPVLAVVVTANRVANHVPSSIFTQYKVDEILAGASLAVLFHSPSARFARTCLRYLPPVVPLALLIVGSFPNASVTGFAYARPYFAALLVGSTICQPEGRWAGVLKTPPLAYIANISYALYLWHEIMPWAASKYTNTPLGYAGRGVLMWVILWAVAHGSTFYVEKPMIRLGNKLAARIKPRRVAEAITA